MSKIKHDKLLVKLIKTPKIRMCMEMTFPHVLM